MGLWSESFRRVKDEYTIPRAVWNRTFRTVHGPWYSSFHGRCSSHQFLKKPKRQSLIEKCHQGCRSDRSGRSISSSSWRSLITGEIRGDTLTPYSHYRHHHPEQRQCDDLGTFSRMTDGYVWPNLYEEARGMAMASFISYPITFILREARSGRLKGSDLLLERLEAAHDGRAGMHIRPGDFLDIVRDNIDHISANYNSGDGLHGWQSVFYLYQQMHDDVQLREFDDRHESTRLVYGIVVNKSMKRITVIFRGTYAEATSDWKRNFQVDQIQVPLPSMVAENHPGDSSNMASIYVYRGIYEYLLQNSDRGPDYPKERYEEILGHLMHCVEEYPDYKVFVTGHSTGGALALLLSFYLACDDRIPKPVTSVSLGSQVIGGADFQRAFERLERDGLLRHLRITNEHDPIPLMPPMAWYKPVGMHLHLYHTTTRSQQGFDIHHASNPTQNRWMPGGQGWVSSTQRLWSAYQEANHNIDQLIEWHNIPAYLRRLERNKAALERLSLNDCYRSKELTGPHFETLL